MKKHIVTCPRCEGEGHQMQCVSGFGSNDPNSEYRDFECEACDGRGWHSVAVDDDDDIEDAARDAVNSVIGYNWDVWTRQL